MFYNRDKLHFYNCKKLRQVGHRGDSVVVYFLFSLPFFQSLSHRVLRDEAPFHFPENKVSA